MSVKYRLALIAGIPLFFVLIYAGSLVGGALADFQNAKSAKTSVQKTKISSELIGNLQRERGLSAGFLGSKGVKFRSELYSQRNVTDQAIVAFNSAFENDKSAAVGIARQNLATITSIRSDVDNLRIEVSKSTGSYINIVNAQLALIGGKMSLLVEGGFGETPSAFIGLLRAKEMAGLERAMGATGYAAGVFPAPIYRNFLQFRGAQIEALSPVLQSMPERLSREADSLLRGSGAREVVKFRATADAAGPNAELQLGLGSDWWAASTSRIDGLTEVETALGDLLVQHADARTGSAFRGLILTVLGVSACLVVTMSIAWNSASAFIRVLGGLSDNLEEIGNKNFDFQVAGTLRKDEFGAIARSLVDVRGRLKAGEAANIEATYKGAGFNGASVAMMIINRDFEIVYVNSAMEKFFCENREDIQSEFPRVDIEGLVDSSVDLILKDPTKQREVMSDAGRLPVRECHVIGNMRVQVDISAVFNRDGEHVGNTLEMTDVSEAFLNAGIIAGIDSTQGIVQFDLNGDVLDANQNFLDAMGYGLDEIQGRNHSRFCKKEYTRSQEYSDLWRELRSGRHYSARVECQRKDGSPIYLDATYNPVMDASGRPFKVVKIANDATQEELSRLAFEEDRIKRAKDLSVVVETLADGLSRVSQGDFTQEIDVEFAEEYTELKADFNAAILKLHESAVSAKETKEQQDFVVEQLEKVLSGLSDGDLVTRLNEEFVPVYDGMRQNFNDALENLMRAMGSVCATADEIKIGAMEVTSANEELSQRTERQAATLEETTAAITEITTTVTHTSKGAQEVDRIVSDTKADTLKSSEIVENAVTAMGRIEDSANEIRSIINVIDDIAFQTNLLALNAGVEAARAGDAGRGFAVVAQEVRGLAQRCTDAAKEIKQLIASSGRNVSEGVALVNTTGEAITAIAVQIEEVSSLAADIAASSQQQSASLEQVAQAVNELDAVTQKNAAMVQETTAASHQMRNDAVHLVDLMENFELGDSRADRAADESAARQTAQVRQRRFPQMITTNNVAPMGDVASEGWEDF